jgi:hypothetical protein
MRKETINERMVDVANRGSAVVFKVGKGYSEKDFGSD